MAGEMHGRGRHVWQERAYVAGGMHGGGVCVAGGICGRGACMVEGCAWQGGMHGGVCMVREGGMLGRGEGMHGRGCAWWGACLARGCAWQKKWQLQRAVRILLEYILVHTLKGKGARDIPPV